MKSEELVVKIDGEEELEEESSSSRRRFVAAAAEDSNALCVDIGDGEDEEEHTGSNDETERTNKKSKRSVNLRSLIAKFQAPPSTGLNTGGDADPYTWFESKDVQQQHKSLVAKKASKRH